MGGGGLSGYMGQRGLHEMRVMRGWEREGCLVRGITSDEGHEGVGGWVVWLHGSKGLNERGRVIHSIRGCWVKN